MTISIFRSFLWVVVAILICTFPSIESKKETSRATTTTTTRKNDNSDHKGLTPFFLQDPYDHTCFGPNGFTLCDENALWLLTTRTNKKDTFSLVSFLRPTTKLCLQRATTWFGLKKTNKLQLESCKTEDSKLWSWEFIDKQHVKLTHKGNCVLRGKEGSGYNRNSISLGNCHGNSFLPLVYHPTAVHENGFLLSTADMRCFDGKTFHSCELANSPSTSNAPRGSSVMDSVLAKYNLHWGVGLKYFSGGEAYRYIFNFAIPERGNCLAYVKKTSSVYHAEKVACNTTNKSYHIYGWGLENGRLTIENGKKCLSRTSSGDLGVFVDCQTTGFEYIYIQVPSLGIDENILKLMSNPVSPLRHFCLYSHR